MDVRPETPAEMKPAGEWNQVTIELRGRSISASINGKGILNQKTLAAGARFPDGTIPALDRVTGRIGLQKHTGTVRFRNIEIRDDSRRPAGGPTDAPLAQVKPRKLPDLSNNRLVFADDFRDPRSGWPRDGKTHGYIGGSYCIDAMEGAWGWNCPSGPLNDSAYRIVGRASGNDESSWGIVLTTPKPNDHGIQVRINRNGELFIEPCMFWNSPIPKGPRIGPVSHPAIRRGDDPNTLVLLVRRRRVEIYVNSEEVCPPVKLDWDLTPCGPALAVFGSAPGKTRAEFHEIEIRHLDGVDDAGARGEAHGP
jgi:hypothetical protein